MTICSWCGQESQNSAVCDWCKRPISLSSAPQSRKTDLEFLREGEGDKIGTVRIVAVVACVVACVALLAFLLVKPTRDQTVAQGPAISAPSGSGSSKPRKITETERRATGRDIEVISRPGIGRPAPPPRVVPQERRSAQVPTNFGARSIIKSDKVDMSMVALHDGTKQIIGKAEVVNPTAENVVQFRYEIVWGPHVYSMTPMVGRRGNLQRLEQTAVKPGGRLMVQLVSQPIPSDAGGSPNALRLTAWLDGPPNNSVDDYLLQMGR